MPDEIREHDEGVIQQALDLLYKHFDACQIFCTRQEPGAMKAKTLAGSYGFGNWYARYGQVHEWLENGGAMAVSGGEAEDDDE